MKVLIRNILKKSSLIWFWVQPLSVRVRPSLIYHSIKLYYEIEFPHFHWSNTMITEIYLKPEIIYLFYVLMYTPSENLAYWILVKRSAKLEYLNLNFFFWVNRELWPREILKSCARANFTTVNKVYCFINVIVRGNLFFYFYFFLTFI